MAENEGIASFNIHQNKIFNAAVTLCSGCSVSNA